MQIKLINLHNVLFCREGPQEEGQSQKEGSTKEEVNCLI